MTAQPWLLRHDLHVMPQIEVRPGEPDAQGDRWLEARRTGKAMAVCTCGYTTGLVAAAELPSPEALAAEHPDVSTALARHTAAP